MHRRRPVVIEGEDAGEILDKWNALPWWSSYDGPDFAQRLVEYTGADDPGYVKEPIELPEDDEILLERVVEALGPNAAVLEERTNSGDPN
jgi:hypothetical protein